ncbi:PIP5K4 [Symbiodinium microadriaticum]|nr:PIP5K4 [Symbiodinium microadriaticum]
MLEKGQGKFEHADGDVFIGEWKRNAAEGLGRYTHAKLGITITGEWAEDVQHGFGVEMWAGGARFEGQYRFGQKQGLGIYRWPDGSVYSGQWRNDTIGGYGHYQGQDGREFKGMWDGAIIHGCGVYIWPDGRMFRSELSRPPQMFSWKVFA